MKIDSRHRSRRLAVALAVVGGTVLLAASPAGAQSEEGSINCGNRIAYVQVTFNDIGGAISPGGGPYVWHDNDNQWHTRYANGAYAGSWHASGDPLLDTALTFASCRPYG